MCLNFPSKSAKNWDITLHNTVICTLQHKFGVIEFDTANGIDISIPIRFSNENLSAFGVGKPDKKPYAVEGFVGSVEQNGSCNCDVVTFIPHCHGTHTECVGHVLKKPVYVSDVLKTDFFMSYLVSVSPEADGKISSNILQQRGTFEKADALIIRTLPNSSQKQSKRYTDQAPYMDKDAIEWMNGKGIQHLLVDFPSLDPIWDGGKLEAHRVFWNLSAGQKEIDQKTWSHKTITELVYVPDEAMDGPYALNLQPSHFMLDAVPSSPIIYPVRTR
jgi:arylformamidase